jgi:hypothetical protein
MFDMRRICTSTSTSLEESRDLRLLTSLDPYKILALIIEFKTLRRKTFYGLSPIPAMGPTM